MTTAEAKFILSAYRPNGRDADLPAFEDALRMAAANPDLAQWLARSRAHDAAVAEKVREIAPPAGLREAILAGARLTESQKSPSLKRVWFAGLAAAAGFAVVIFTMTSLSRPSGASTFATFAIGDLTTEHGGSGAPASALIAQLQARGGRMPTADQIDFEKLRETGCRTLNLAGHDVLEVCFDREGTQFHFYVARRDGPLVDSVGKGPSFITEAAGAAVVWADKRFDYAITSVAGVAAIRRLF
ncbi:MAG TPA: hypothetical protein VGG37_02460 [Opitutaceae bacterium]|jgi:hypothetical protein